MVCCMWRPVRLEKSRGLLKQDNTNLRDAKKICASVAPQEVCDNLVNALQLLANQQTGGDSTVDVPVEGFQERSRLKMMEELRRLITVDNQAVKIGDMEKYSGIALGGEAHNHRRFP